MIVTTTLVALLLLFRGPGGRGDRTHAVRGNSPETGYAWTQLTADAGSPEGYNYQMFADSGTTRVFHPRGIWSSTDGKTWRKTELTDVVRNQAFVDYVRFNGFVYGLGTFEGNIERHTQTTQIARTKDFRTWVIVAAESDLPKRYFFHPFVFREKLYMLDHDAWVSDDGLEWKLLTPKIAEGEIFGHSPPRSSTAGYGSSQATGAGNSGARCSPPPTERRGRRSVHRGLRGAVSPPASSTAGS